VGETVKGYEASAWFGMGAPAKTPKDAIAVLNSTMNEALKAPNMVARLADLGGTPMGGTPEDFGKIIVAETTKWKKVVEFAGVSVD
jgi:tripartite-type tricarboxylate transporter receptor subunit TctC